MNIEIVNASLVKDDYDILINFLDRMNFNYTVEEPNEGEESKFSLKEALEIWDVCRLSTVNNSSIEYDAIRDMEFVEFDYSVIDKDKQRYFFDKFGIEI